MNSKYNQSSSYALSITSFSAQFIHFFCFPWAEPRPLSYCLLQSRFSCDSDSWAVINTVMVSDRLLKIRMTEPGGVQNPILLARRASVIDKYEGVVIRSCPQIFVIFKWVALTLCVWEKVLHTLFKVNTFINTIGWRDWWAALGRKEPCPELFPDWVGKDVANADHRLTHAPW